MLKISKQGVDVGIVIADIEVQKRFYREVLGFPLVGELPLPNGSVHVFACGDSLLKLYALRGARPDTAGNEFGSKLGLGYISVSVTDIQEAFATCERAGVRILAPLSEFTGQGGGAVRARFAMLADPEGNRIELFQHVS